MMASFDYNVSRTSNSSQTRLALTSVLGPFAAEIHSTVTPRCIDALCGVRIPFQSLAQSPKGNPDSSPPVQSPVMFTH